MKKIFLIIFLYFVNCIIGFTEIPKIPQKDIIFEKANNGYDLFIKKIDGINSILLTESQRDPFFKKTNYGLRTLKFHPCNGNEKRLLNGRLLETKYDIYFLVDSTTEKHDILGDSFHFFIPEKIIYGYDWTRQGEILVKIGTKINLRLFEKEYADYTGDFIDQWVTVKIKASSDKFHKNIIENFTELSDTAKTDVIIKSDSDSMEKILKDYVPENINVGLSADVVFIIDTTISMKEEIPVFKKIFPDLKRDILKKVKNLRIGLILYRDYGEMFLTKVYDLTDNLDYIDKLVKNINIEGGADIPEALNEAIYELNNLEFQSNDRIVFLIADAPAHPEPRGKISREQALETITKTKVIFIPICLPYK